MKTKTINEKTFSSKFLKLDGKYYDNKGNITLFFLDKDNKKYMLNFNDKTYVFNYSIIEKEKTTDDILKEWITLYKNKDIKPGLSSRHCVSKDDEWLCEAYMETDYSTLTQEDFEQTVRDYVAYLVKNGDINE